MNEADALLDAIFDNPDDDTPRLVYADWLQEHDQENYAQFIRLQCAVAHYKVWSDEANDLWEKIGRVWNRLADEWWPATVDYWPGLGLYNLHGQIELDAVHFHRGFLRDSYPLSFSQLVTYSRTCWPWLPFPVTNLIPDQAEYSVAELARLTRIRHLKVARWYDDDGLWTLIDSPLLCNLQVLDLTGGILSTGEIDVMLKPGMYPRLQDVRLGVYDEETAIAQMTDIPMHGAPSPSSFIVQIQKRLEARFAKVTVQPKW
ncbi:MAG: hypothetical protein C0467_10480 [Planctomycetaceae bacterium]|nr:hypothetical protein [Planctomycetaceae bacterium]